MNISPMLLVIERTTDAMVRETPFPDLHSRSRFFHEPMRIAALDELHGALKGNCWFGSEKQMDMVGHEDKFVELEDFAVAVTEKNFGEKGRCSL